MFVTLFSLIVFKMQDLLTYIDERLTELEQEKEELQEFHQLDKDRRALQYTLYESEIKDSTRLLQAMETTRNEVGEEQQLVHSRMAELESRKAKLEENVNAGREQLNRLLVKLAEKSNEVHSANASRAEIDAAVLEAEVNARSRSEELTQIRNELEDIRQKMGTCSAELNALEPQFEKQTQELSRLAAENDHIRSEIEGLYGKQGRGQQFKTKKERDTFLQQQINLLNQQVTSNSSSLSRQQTEITGEEARLNKEKERMRLAENELTNKNTRVGELSRQIQQFTVERNQLQEQRRKCWTEMETLSGKIEEATGNRDRAKQQLNTALPRNISQGMKFRRRCFGLLYISSECVI
jgi:structural maintenance of chromosome 3 (chondroitin sulfate proteoglycan 6)